MIYLSATEAKQNFAEFLDKAQKEPITCSFLPLSTTGAPLGEPYSSTSNHTGEISSTCPL
jgi:hypothetical protein